MKTAKNKKGKRCKSQANINEDKKRSKKNN